MWLGYIVSEDQSTKAGYNDTLKKVHVIKTYNDLIYYWQESRFRNILEFLVQEHDTNHNKVSSYIPSYLGMKLTARPGASAPSITSGKASTPPGRTRTTKMVAGLFFKSTSKTINSKRSTSGSFSTS